MDLPFALFHGAEYGFAAHQHDVSHVAHDGHDSHGEQEHETSRGACDLLLYLEGHTRPHEVVASDLFGIDAVPVLFADRESGYIERGQFASAPRAPPFPQHI